MRYQSKRPKRQFLAGVRCSQCNEVDKVVQVQLFAPIADEYIECVACGYQERRPTREQLEAQQAANSVQTDEPVQVVQLR